MDFGRLPNVDRVHFELPDEPAANARILATGTDEQTALRLGTPRWGDTGFVGKIYPRGTKSGDFLKHYSRQFTTIELNTTYYGVRPDSIERWAAATPPEFRFCPKFPGAISHEAELVNTERATDAFFDSIEAFGSRLGVPWVVLPPNFAPDRLAVLDAFLRHATQRHRIAVELRHPAWFLNASAFDRAFELLERHCALAVITDVAGRRDACHMRLASTATMIRFVGNALHPSDLTRLDAWSERLAAWCRAGLDEAWIFLHQPAESLTVELAEHIAPRLAETIGAKVATPRRVQNNSQGMLF